MIQGAHISVQMQAGALVHTDKWVSPSGPMKYVPGIEDTLSDEALLRFCAEGESAALRELVRRYQGPLYRFLARLMGSDEDAEDAALEVFVRAWKNAPRFQYRAKVATWLYRIAVNIARDAHSRKKVRPKEVWLEDAEVKFLGVESAEDEALRTVGREYQSSQLRRALERLSGDDRLILVLYYLEDREYEEIQAITGLSYTVLKTRLARARRRLRKWMEAEIIEAEK